MAMGASHPNRPKPPLNATKLDEMALNYVGRFATSRSKLLAYLRRKVRARGWGEVEQPDLDGLADRLVRLGYVDDRAYAVAKARSLTGRGYGERRVRQALAQAGIAEEEAGDARELATSEAVAAALHFARRRSIGPFASARPDPRNRERALAAMIRAGHGFALARAIIDLDPGEKPDAEVLATVR